MGLDQGLAAELQGIGFTMYEARVYLALVREGILSGPAVARASGVPKSKVYDVLKRLMKKRVIEEFVGAPRKFKARQPSHVLNELVESERAKLKTIESRAGELGSRISSMLDRTEKTYLDKDDILWTVNGRRAFHEKFVEMGERSRSEVLVITPYFSRNTIMERCIAAAVSRGVVFRGLTAVNEDNRQRVRYYQQYFKEMLNFKGELPITVLIIDDSECMYRMNYRVNGQQNYIGIHSTNPGMVKAFKQYWNGLKADSTVFKG